MLPKKYHAIAFMSTLVMLLLLGLYLLSSTAPSVDGGQSAAAAKTAALARGGGGGGGGNPSSSASNNVFSQQSVPAYRHPIMYDKLTGATNNQINDVLGAGKQPTLITDYPLDHYQQQQQQPPQSTMPPPPPQHLQPPPQNLLADAQQQQRHRQQMLDSRQMLFNQAGPSPFGPQPGIEHDFANQTTNYYPDPALYRMQPPPPPPPPSMSQVNQHQSGPIRPPYAHLAPLGMPMNQQQQQQQQHQLEQQQLNALKQQQQQGPPAAPQNRIIPLNSRIDPSQQQQQHHHNQMPLPLPPPPPPPPSQQQQQQQQQQSQLVLASNNPPPSTNKNNLGLLQAGSNRLASSAAWPLCAKQQFDLQQQQQPQPPVPQPPQQVPNSTPQPELAASSSSISNSSKLQMPILFCNIDPEYPTKEIMRALELYATERSIEHLLPQLLIQLHIQGQPQPRQQQQQPATLDQLQWSVLAPDEQQQQQQQPRGGLSSSSSSSSSFPSSNFEQMCRSSVQMAQPRRAKNLAGQWKVVVNLPGHKYRGIAISQMVRVEECSAPLGECAQPAKPQLGLAKSSCLQHYENQRLVAWSHQQGLHLDMFRIPVACSCHIRR